MLHQTNASHFSGGLMAGKVRGGEKGRGLSKHMCRETPEDLNLALWGKDHQGQTNNKITFTMCSRSQGWIKGPDVQSSSLQVART